MGIWYCGPGQNWAGVDVSPHEGREGRDRMRSIASCKVQIRRSAEGAHVEQVWLHAVPKSGVPEMEGHGPLDSKRSRCKVVVQQRTSPPSYWTAVIRSAIMIRLRRTMCVVRRHQNK